MLKPAPQERITLVEAARRVAQTRRACGILVVEAGAKEHPAASLVGAVACLTKPFRLEAVRELLRSLDLQPSVAVAPAE